MANKYPSHSNMSWVAEKWSNLDDDAQDEAAPAIGDDVFFTANSGAVLVGEGDPTNALAALDAREADAVRPHEVAEEAKS